MQPLQEWLGLQGCVPGTSSPLSSARLTSRLSSLAAAACTPCSLFTSPPSWTPRPAPCILAAAAPTALLHRRRCAAGGCCRCSCPGGLLQLDVGDGSVGEDANVGAAGAEGVPAWTAVQAYRRRAYRRTGVQAACTQQAASCQAAASQCPPSQPSHGVPARRRLIAHQAVGQSKGGKLPRPRVGAQGDVIEGPGVLLSSPCGQQWQAQAERDWLPCRLQSVQRLLAQRMPQSRTHATNTAKLQLGGCRAAVCGTHRGPAAEHGACQNNTRQDASPSMRRTHSTGRASCTPACGCSDHAWP